MGPILAVPRRRVLSETDLTTLVGAIHARSELSGGSVSASSRLQRRKQLDVTAAPEEMLAALTAFLAPYRNASAIANGARAVASA